MMYNKHFVTSIKVAGKILREQGDTVYVPYNSEYSIYLKNMNTRRAEVKIEIDGDSIGNSIILNANSSLDLERFLTDNNQGNRFKFLERTKSIEDYRGINAEDGLIRIEFAYEKQYLRQDGFNPGYWKNDETALPPDWYGNRFMRGTATGAMGQSYGGAGGSLSGPAFASCNTVSTQSVGITAPGSVSDQKFSSVMGFATDAAEVIVLRLVGETLQGVVQQPVTVKAKPKCTMCGRVNKATSKFCSNCGAGLILV